MKFRKLLIVLSFTLILTGCNLNLKLYDPKSNETNSLTNSNTSNQLNVINDSNYTGTINYAPSSQTKLTKEQVYENGVNSTVYIIATNDNSAYLGSGVFFSEDSGSNGNAYLFTNAHVIKDSNHIEIIYANYKRDTAYLVGYNLYEDIAVLQVKKNSNYTIPALKNRDNLKVGEEILTIGTPVSTDLSFFSTHGVISKIDTPIPSYYDDNYGLLLLGVDATLNSGNSGGPLFDMYGNLIGLNTMKLLYDNNLDPVDDLNFAIPIDRAVFIANKIFNKQGYIRGKLGITIIDIVDLSLQERTSYSINLDYGIYIDEVAENSASSNLLYKGDIITKINGIEFKNKIQFQRQLFNYNLNEQFSLTVYRNNQYLDINISLK